MASFISSSAAFSLTSSSFSGASSLVPLLLGLPSTRPLNPLAPSKPSAARMLANAFFKSFFRSSPPRNSIDEPLPVVPKPAGRADKFPFAHFVSLVRNAPDSIRALPITAVESYQVSGENAGPVPHRYSVVTIQHGHGRSTYLKLQLRTVERTLTSVLTVGLADDRAALVRPHDRRLAALELTIPEPQPGLGAATQCQGGGGPSLDALAELLDVIQQRAGRYDPCSRNCLWLADLVFFGSAVKFREAWLGDEGRIWPGWPIRKYLRGEMSVLAASTQCFLSERAPGWMASAYGTLRGVLGEFNMQREVEEVVKKWQGYMDAVPVEVDVVPVRERAVQDPPPSLLRRLPAIVRAAVTVIFG